VVADGKLYVFGGYINTTFNPADQTCMTRSTIRARITDLPKPLSHVGTAVDGKDIYLAGGYVGNNWWPDFRYKTSGIQRGHEDLDRHALAAAGTRVWGLELRVGTSSAARISIVQIRATTGFCPWMAGRAGAALNPRSHRTL